MENFIEKLKSVDKKVWIGVGIGVAVLVLIVILVIALGGNKPSGKPGNSQNSVGGTQAGTENGSEVIGSEGLGTESLGTEVDTEIETEVGTEGTEGTATPIPGEGGVTITPPTEEGQQHVTTKPSGEEILGLGSKDEPYLERPVDMKVTTVQIGAGKELYYGVYIYDSKYITINDPDAYIIYRNKRYDASNGRVSVKLRKPTPGEPVQIQVGNKGASAKSFVIHFSDVEGSWDSKTKVNSIVAQSTYRVDLAAGNEIGYYYTYTAEKTGVIRFYVNGTAASGLDVQNTNLGETDGASFAEDKYVKTDANGRKYITLAVTQGEVIYIHVCAEPDASNAYPATTITWEAYYE